MFCFINIFGTHLYVHVYAGYAYYGEYPLAFAACFGHEEMYDYLIDHGADPNLADSFGNTVLHMLVISNQIVSAFTAVHFYVFRSHKICSTMMLRDCTTYTF